MQTQPNQLTLSSSIYALLKSNNLKFDIDWLSANGFEAFESIEEHAQSGRRRRVSVNFIRKFNSVSVLITHDFFEPDGKSSFQIAQSVTINPENPFLTDDVLTMKDLKSFLSNIEEMFGCPVLL